MSKQFFWHTHSHTLCSLNTTYELLDTNTLNLPSPDKNYFYILGINKRPILLGPLKTSVLRAPHVKIPIQGKPAFEVLENLHESHSPPNLLHGNPTGNMTTLTSAIYSQIPAGEIGILNS